MKVTVDASCDIHYTSTYLQGLRALFGEGCIRFASAGFHGFRHNNDCVAMVLSDGSGLRRRVVIDFGDSKTIKEKYLDWSDVYAKVNLTPEDAKRSEKTFAIGPVGPGIRCFGAVETFRHALWNGLAAYRRIPDIRRFLSDYKTQLRRLPQSDYDRPGRSDPDYIHFVSSIWKNDRVTNDYRANFMRAAQRTEGLVFEGGFAPRPDGAVSGYEDLTGRPFEPLPVYREKMMRSLAVFNTPAVKQCHGWKLPEFLAWGKAVITTPPVRMLPVHQGRGEHALLTDGSEADIHAKIGLLRADSGLRDRLERNARAYYDAYLSPARVMSRIAERAGMKER